MQPVIFEDLGLIDYKAAWDYQEKLHAEIVNLKLENRKQSPDTELPTPHYLLFASILTFIHWEEAAMKNLLASDSELKNAEATFYKNNRGGDITYHGPGQIVGYPILNLDLFFTDIHKYLRYLEEAIIRTLKEYEIESGRIDGLTGVWIEGENKSRARKICAFGVRCSRWVTMHGFAFNVNTDLNYFGKIVPCGIQDKAVTSLERELGRKMEMNEVKEKVKFHLADLFQMELLERAYSRQ